MTPATSRTSVLLPSVRDMDASVWTATLCFGGGEKQPTVKLERQQPFCEAYTYLVASFLECAAENRGFNFGDLGRDATSHRLSPVATAALAAEARRRIPATVGRFEVLWLPDDGKVPF